MLTIEICGYNKNCGICENSTNPNSTEDSINSPIYMTTFNISTLLSYSAMSSRTVAVTTDGVAHGIGDNKKGQISRSIPISINKKFTNIPLQDSNDQPCSAISAVCGDDYTLYLISPTKGDRNQLAYSHSKINIQLYPIILNIGEMNPVSLFGGYSTSAAIDKNGSIIYLPPFFYKKPMIKLETFSMPSDQKADSLACCEYFVISHTTTNRLFESEIRDKLVFKEVPELKGKEVTSLSGIFMHCFAVTKDGRVYARGSNFEGQLGLGKNVKKTDKFIEISSLKKYKICHAYAGVNHSIFQTIDGKLLACGNNDYGQLMLKSGPCREKVYEPVETTVTNVSFCIVGNQTTVYFKNYEPPMNGNTIKTSTPKISPPPPTTISTHESESSTVSSLKSKILSLEKQIKSRDDRIKLLEKQITQKDSELENLKNSSKNKEENDDDQNLNIKLFDYKDIDELDIIEVISETLNSIVQKVVKKNPQIFALKKMIVNKNNNNNNFEQVKQFLNEHEIINRLNHPNIIKTFGFFYGDKKRPTSILLEYCPLNLDQAIKEKRLSNVDKCFYIYQIVEGMKYLHSIKWSDDKYKLIHRDLKPSNILISSDGIIKISDFGISKLMSIDDDQTMTKAGTPLFMAPEIFNEKKYDEKVDVYSFGVVLFIILSGKQPKMPLASNNLSSSFNKSSKILISSCWEDDPKKRCSFNTIMNFLDKNLYKLIDLKTDEVEIIRSLVEKHKKIIPNY